MKNQLGIDIYWDMIIFCKKGQLDNINVNGLKGKSIIQIIIN